MRAIEKASLWLLLAASAWLVGCASLPERPAESVPVHSDNTDGTRLGRVVAPFVAEHPGLSGVFPLERGVDAFAARMALASAAERSLDVQYYIWRPDDSGKLLADQLIQAADRGVHVRVLLDDIGAAASDTSLLALDSHTNIEVRLFNPVSHRRFRKLSFLFEFGRANRRMHNKSFTVDNQVTIIGGRNIGDEYFGASSSVEFADFDVLAVGPVVAAATSAFELYWRSPSSVPISFFTAKKVSPQLITQRRAALAAHREMMGDTAFGRAARDSRLMGGLPGLKLELSWGRAWLMYDLPDKVATSPENRATHLAPQLRPVADAAEREVIVVSPYFVPGKQGVSFFQVLRKRGVRVVIITNSLAATDVVAVHAGYRRYRKALLHEGVQLYETKASRRSEAPSGQDKHSRGQGRGSSRASLHAKTFVFDQRLLFVGSMNLDPRSVSLNTEIGAIFEVPDLAVRVVDAIEGRLLHDAYRLEFVPGPGPSKKSGRINWLSEDNGRTLRYKREPGASFGRRFQVWLLSLFPIESQL
ncbi:MAG TPA: phospholipase D family protein [Candidatus Acidoferrum sp.]|jgi:putative cardiolipin synthase|nr:phospholipase D family protein [Candidatus Acidoferrum sp.]